MNKETFDNKYKVYNLIYKATKSGNLIWNRNQGTYSAVISGQTGDKNRFGDYDILSSIKLICYPNGLEFILDDYTQFKYYVPDEVLYKVITIEWIKRYNSKMDNKTFNIIENIINTSGLLTD